MDFIDDVFEEVVGVLFGVTEDGDLFGAVGDFDLDFDGAFDSGLQDIARVDEGRFAEDLFDGVGGDGEEVILTGHVEHVVVLSFL